MMPVAILCGGLATRLHPVTLSLPKSLLYVSGKPFILWQLELLKQNKLTDIVLCVGNQGEMIKAQVGDGSQYGVKVEYSWDGPVALGTGGALKRALPMLGRTFCVLYGDSYLDAEYQPAIKAFQESHRMWLQTLYQGEDYGLNIFDARAFNYWLSPDSTFDLHDLFKKLITRGAWTIYNVPTRYYEIGTPEGLAETREYLESKKC